MNASPESGARVRVFLPTYRRRTLLPRAVASLRAQTMRDWVCELHNDDPTDSFPGELVRELADPRIRLVQHARNLGPIETFNQFYRPTPEPFYALLEDDNTWAPAFLETMLSALAKHPQATLAWCNQRIVRETADGSLHETGTFARELEASFAPRLQAWEHPGQLMGALHANGAMVMRSRPGETYETPAIPFGCIEAFRERMFPHPLVYVPEPLATFTITMQTARRHDLREWGAALAMLTATYLKHAHFDATALAALCGQSRQANPPTTNVLIAATCLCPEVRALRSHLRLADWLRFLKNAFRHPQNTWHSLRARSRHPDWWDLLDRHTATRFRETPIAPDRRSN